MNKSIIIFKRLSIACFLIAGFLVVNSELRAQSGGNNGNQEPGIAIPENSKYKITVKVRIARPVKKCESGFWFCKVDVSGTGGLGKTASAREADADMFLDVDNSRLIVSFNDDLPEANVTEFYAEAGDEITLGEEFTKQFGKKVTLVPSKCTIQRNKNPKGILAIPVIME